jgi:uncharacterized hydrophobic protein (TIGR00341 family)
MVCPEQKRHEVEQLVQEHQPLGLWHDRLLDEQVLVKILMPAERAEEVLDHLETNYGGMEGFRILLLPVQAALPRPELPPEPPGRVPFQEAPKPLPTRISRQELYAEISGGAKFSRVFPVLIALSAVVAAIGMWRGNVAVIIGAMVIAPLLGPNMALALATTLGDGRLGRRALFTNLAAILTALAASVLLGVILPVQPDSQQLMARCQVSLADVAIGLAAGSAGALAFTTGIPTALVGVMVAVALLPPLVALGMTLGSAHWAMARGALLLFGTNLICVNLAGVATFLAHGIRPRTWWEADRAQSASRQALTVWLLLLLALVVIIAIAQGPG